MKQQSLVQAKIANSIKHDMYQDNLQKYTFHINTNHLIKTSHCSWKETGYIFWNVHMVVMKIEDFFSNLNGQKPAVQDSTLISAMACSVIFWGEACVVSACFSWFFTLQEPLVFCPGTLTFVVDAGDSTLPVPRLWRCARAQTFSLPSGEETTSLQLFLRLKLFSFGDLGLVNGSWHQRQIRTSIFCVPSKAAAMT